MKSHASRQEKLNKNLAHAAGQGDAATLAALLAQGGDPTANGSTALCWAAKHGHAECVELLIPCSDARSFNSYAIRQAASRGHLECVKLLIPVSDPKADNSYALLWASVHGHIECVKLLIPFSDPKADDSCALFTAAAHDYTECVKLLMPCSHPLSTHPAPFNIAIQNGCAASVALMLDADPRLINLIDPLSASQAAADKGQSALAALLVSTAEKLSIAAAAEDGLASATPSTPAFRL